MPPAESLAAPIILNDWARKLRFTLDEFRRSRSGTVDSVDWLVPFTDMQAGIAGIQATASTWQPPAVELPAGLLNTSGRWPITTPNLDMRGAGRSSMITLSMSTGATVVPVIDILANNVSLSRFAIDQQAQLYTQNDCYAGDPGASSAVLVQGDYARLDWLSVTRAFGNGFFPVLYGVGFATAPAPTGSPRVDPAFTAGRPQGMVADHIFTSWCGLGNGSGRIGPAGKTAAGFDLGGCSGSTLTNFRDDYSTLGLVIDTGDGAFVKVSNAWCFYSQLDASYPTNGSGTGAYCAGGNNQVDNLHIVEPQGLGIWLDWSAWSSIKGLHVRYPGGHGVAIKGNWHLTDCHVINASQAEIRGGVAATANFCGFTPNGTGHRWDAYRVESAPSGGGVDYSLPDLMLTDCYAYGTSHNQGYRENPAADGSSPITATVRGGKFEGANASTLPPARLMQPPPGPYASDSAAAAGGVALGQTYRDASGIWRVRLA